MSESLKFTLSQSLPTNGARAAAVFTINSETYLVIPQLSQDDPRGPIGMNAGDSNIPLVIYKESGGQFEEFQALDVPGGEDAEFFSIGDRHFLATASLRSGSGPYNWDVESVIFEWVDSRFVEFQRIPTFAAKQWHHFTIANRHFLALAQGVDVPGLTSPRPADSTIYEWDGSVFSSFQTVPSKWGYNWAYFALDGADFLAYADHVEPSIVLKWEKDKFVHFQTLDGSAGRAFSVFSAGKTTFLAFARLLSNSVVYRWDGQRLVHHQELEGLGGREFSLFKQQSDLFLIQARFMTGSQQEPKVDLDSTIYKVTEEGLKLSQTFPTKGATDVSVFPYEGQNYAVVAESLDENIKFRTDTHVYRIDTDYPQSKKTDTGLGFQAPEFLKLFTTYTSTQSSIGSELARVVTSTTTDLPLLVATSFDMIFFPGRGGDPSFTNYRVGARGFKELAATSHLGPALASLVKMRELGTPLESILKLEKQLLADCEAARSVNSETLWTDQINVEAFKGRGAAISSMVHYALNLTIKFLNSVIQNPCKLTDDFLRDSYLEAKDDALGATIPFNAVMIASFFLVGLDISYRVRKWLKQNNVEWGKAMVLVTGKQGRATSGVTLNTNSVAQMIIEASNLHLPVERLYIAPHGPVPTLTADTSTQDLRGYETTFRQLWNSLYGVSELGETMFKGYPAYAPAANDHPSIDAATASVAELPRISDPNDWLSMTTRLRVVLEDARQLLSGCVTDYAAEQLRVADSDVSKVVVPGLDGFDYSLNLN